MNMTKMKLKFDKDVLKTRIALIARESHMTGFHVASHIQLLSHALTKQFLSTCTWICTLWAIYQLVQRLSTGTSTLYILNQNILYKAQKPLKEKWDDLHTINVLLSAIPTP